MLLSTGVWGLAFGSFGHLLRSRTSGLYANSIFSTFVRHGHTVFHISRTIFHSHQHCTRAPVSPQLRRHCYFLLFDSNHSDGCEVVSHCALVFIFKSDLSTEWYTTLETLSWLGFLKMPVRKIYSPSYIFYFVTDVHIYSWNTRIFIWVVFVFSFIVCLMYSETIPRASTGEGSYLVHRCLYKRLLRLHGQFPLQETQRFFFFYYSLPIAFSSSHI